MEAFLGIKEDIKKLFLIYFIPGIVATWPWVFLIGTWFKKHPLVSTDVFSDYPVPTYLFILLFFYGTGHFVAKLGARLEVGFENYLFKGRSKKVYQDNWYNYLGLDFKKTEPPLILRYYGEFIIGLKFELNTLAAIPLMLGTLLPLEHFQCLDLMEKNSLIVLCFLSTAVWIYLLLEAEKGIVTANELRSKMFDLIPALKKSS